MSPIQRFFLVCIAYVLCIQYCIERFTEEFSEDDMNFILGID